MCHLLLYVVGIAVLIALDQITKYLATLYLAPVGVLPFIPGVMELRYVLNDGAAFSLLSGVEGGRVILLVFTGIALAALVLIIAGGLGNFVDRALNGVVVDFFATTFMNFAVFNVADIFVCMGVGLMVLSLLLEEYRSRKKARAERQAPHDLT